MKRFRTRWRGLCLLAACVLAGAAPASAQRISGLVIDTEQQSIPGVNVVLPALGRGTTTNAEGRFQLDGLPADTLEVRFSFIGYATEVRRVDLTRGSATLTVMLRPEVQEISEIEVTAAQDPGADLRLGSQSIAVLTAQDLDQHRGQTLGETLEDVPGVTVLQTGPSIAKPVIRGLHSQRVLVLNAGVPQEGQQWGAEHAPEIDPFAPGRIEVLKGAAGVEYGAGALGGVIRVDPTPLPEEPGAGGELTLNGFSNNRQGAGSLLLEGGAPAVRGLGWRLQGSLRKAGDARTPSYVIGNSAFHELNGSAAVGLHRSRMGVDLYLSHFGTELGIYRGAHIGNAADLLRAFEQGRPLVEYPFSYEIRGPKQVIAHDLATLSAHYHFRSGDRLEARYGFQHNRRREYDAHRPYGDSLDATERPAFALRLLTHTAEFKLRHRPIGNLIGGIGVNGMRQGNVNGRAGFLVPNFRVYSGGVHAIESWIRGAWTVEAGARADYRWVRAYPRVGREYVARVERYGNVSGAVGVVYQFAPYWSLGANAGTGWRAPSVNELYNNGVHHGTAQYEIGDPALRSERALNLDVTLRHAGRRSHGEFSVYNNRFDGFIYLLSRPDPTVTIRGVFPTFQYAQADAVLRGFDGSLEYRLTGDFAVGAGASLVRGHNLETDEPLVGMPADRLRLKLHFDLPERRWLRDAYVEGVANLVRRQDRVPAAADRFVINGETVRIEPPDGYAVFGLDFGSDLRIGQVPLRLFVSVENLLNTAYRDYQSRFRYFIDEPGRSVVVRLQIPFGRSGRE